jgi:hypothetical protein
MFTVMIARSKCKKLCGKHVKRSPSMRRGQEPNTRRSLGMRKGASLKRDPNTKRNPSLRTSQSTMKSTSTKTNRNMMIDPNTKRDQSSKKEKN